MNTVFVKLRMRGNANKYRKMLSTDEQIYAEVSELVQLTYAYSAGATLEPGEWFKIENASQQPYAIEVIRQNLETLDFDSLARSEFAQIDYFLVKSGDTIYFQNVSKTRLASKKRLGSFGEAFRYESDSKEIVINEMPDAIYCSEADILYFRKLEPIVGIFKGIAELYREVTDAETEEFLQNSFIALKDNYGTSNVKTANRKRIAMANATLSALNIEERSEIFSYIGEYCPDLKTENNAFSVSCEDELRLVLFGIEQRFYTTPVGEEKRIANSVIPM